jgi:TolB protein
MALGRETEDGDLALYVVNADGSDETRLTEAVSTAGGAIEWSSDGTMIAFERRLDYDAPGDVWVVKTDGSGQRPVILTEGLDETGPHWSPDGRTIALLRQSRDVWVMDAGGGCQRNVTRQAPRIDSYFWLSSTPWSPDGRKLAFISDRKSRLYVVGVDGAGLQNLAEGLAVREFSWSPDGERILLVVGGPPADREIHVTNSDGTDFRRLTTTTHSQEMGAAWSPDGARIAFMRWDFPQTSPKTTFDIYTMNADGSDQRRLTHGDWDYYPEWSPDGKKIAFSRGDPSFAPTHVWVMNRDGSDAVNLTARFGTVEIHSWEWRPQLEN